MGSSESHLCYSAPVLTDKKPIGETYIYRSLNYSKDIQFEYLSYQEVILSTVKRHSTKPFLGTRVPSQNNLPGPYRFKTYEQILDLSINLGSGILNLGLAPAIKEYNDLEIQFVGIYSRNREEWLELDFACCLYKLTTVPVYDTLGPDSVVAVLENTNLTTIFCSGSYINKLLKIIEELRSTKLQNIVSFERPDERQLTQAQKLNINLYSWNEVLQRGKLQRHKFSKVNSNDIYTFCYTSGTTGEPKAAMITHGNVISLLQNAKRKDDYQITTSDVYLSYLPLAHIFERLCCCVLVMNGAQIGFYSGDVFKLKLDLLELKPTLFISVPRLYNKFYEAMKESILKLSGIKRVIAMRAIKSKLDILHKDGKYTHMIYDSMIFNKFRKALGGRIRYMLTGSAPIDDEVIDFLKITLSCPIFEGYGLTEATASSFITHAHDGKSGHVGGPFSNVEFKFVDVPEMSYTSEDKDVKGEPQPRGEICLRGPTVFKGYYKDSQKTSEVIDENAWLHTGDIGLLNKNGSVSIIDRKKNMLKLAAGEYIAVEKIEMIYKTTKYVEEIFVYGESSGYFLVAVVVPDRMALLPLAESLGIQGNFEEICQNKKLEEMVLEEMDRVATNENLRPFEMVKKIIFDPVPFINRNLFTPSFKLKRHEAIIFYKNQLEELCGKQYQK